MTTRTTTLTAVPHSTFALRFSELGDVEASLHEDEEQRAGRTFDWIGARIGARSARWVEAFERRGLPTKDDGLWRTPWWDEVKRCVEGENVPNRYEGWNHPAASTSFIILDSVWHFTYVANSLTSSSHICGLNVGFQSFTSTARYANQTARLPALGRPDSSTLLPNCPSITV